MAITPVDASTVTDNFSTATNAYWNSGNKALTNGRISGSFERYSGYDPYGEFTGSPSEETTAPLRITTTGITMRTYAGQWSVTLDADPGEHSQGYRISAYTLGTGNSQVQARIGGTTNTAVTYDATAMAYWRFRTSGTSGQTGYIDYSADRSTWTQFHSGNYAITAAGPGVFHLLSLYGSTGGTLDDFNLTTAASGPVRKVSAYVGGTWTLKPVLSYIGGAWVEKPVAKYP